MISDINTVDDANFGSGDYSDYPSCMEDEFSCWSDPGVCIPLALVCDHLRDCRFSEDEMDCD